MWVSKFPVPSQNCDKKNEEISVTPERGWRIANFPPPDRGSNRGTPHFSTRPASLTAFDGIPWSSSLEHAEQTACCLLTIAQCGKYYVADHRALVPVPRFSRQKGT